MVSYYFHYYRYFVYCYFKQLFFLLFETIQACVIRGIENITCDSYSVIKISSSVINHKSDSGNCKLK